MAEILGTISKTHPLNQTQNKTIPNPAIPKIFIQKMLQTVKRLFASFAVVLKWLNDIQFVSGLCLCRQCEGDILSFELS